MIRCIETFATPDVCLVRVTREDGLQGWGQTAPHHADITAACVHRHVARHALRHDEADIAGLAECVAAAEYKFTGSYLFRALAGVETALWDLEGRAKGRSVCELLGGRLRPLRAYASSMRRDISPRDEAERMKRLVGELGYTAAKVRIGARLGADHDEWPGRTQQLLPAMRRALGNSVDLLVDANGAYTVPGILALKRLLIDNGVMHIEEPCPFWDIEATAAVRAAMPMVVAGGEQDCDLAQWGRIIRMPAVDTVQPDVCYLGGPVRLLQVAAMASKAGLPCVPHSANRSLLMIFTLHLMAAIENVGPYVECSIEEPPWARDLYAPAIEVRDGAVQAPDGPGWGVRINPEWLLRAERQQSTV